MKNYIKCRPEDPIPAGTEGTIEPLEDKAEGEDIKPFFNDHT